MAVNVRIVPEGLRGYAGREDLGGEEHVRMNYYKVLFTALVARTVEADPGRRAVKLSQEEMHKATTDLELVEWPITGFTRDFSIKQRG